LSAWFSFDDNRDRSLAELKRLPPHPRVDFSVAEIQAEIKKHHNEIEAVKEKDIPLL
jgi:hypothetical protein